MARPTGNEELQLKKRARRRLIGAIVLVMVVVLVLPMVLDNEPKPVSQDIDIRIPSPDAGAFKSKIVPIAPAPDGKPAAKSPAGAAPGREGAKKDAAGSEGAPVASEAPAMKSEVAKAGQDAAKGTVAADTSKPPVKAETPKAEATKMDSATGTHVVQVAALLNAERAAEIHERIRTAGIRSYTEIVTTAKGDVTRVRAGPFPTSEAAENAREQIQRIEFDGKKLDGKVIPVK